MNATEVIQLIEDAWRDAVYPGDSKIFTSESNDDEDITRYFCGTTWRGHEPSNLRAHSSAFTFFTPEAFHYWLPAFMIAAITSPWEADVILHYIPRSVGDGYAAQRLLLFSQNQKLATAEYMRWRIELRPNGSYDERKALAVLERSA
ncbi:hypothetical protein [Prosthecobacter sp.]|uniref:hypothetical protein n=1 Tax=Prosthecobacter sp. TaxID=1965333 RepID=UPI003783CDB1